jgi:hypothetical protein
MVAVKLSPGHQVCRADFIIQVGEIKKPGVAKNPFRSTTWRSALYLLAVVHVCLVAAVAGRHRHIFHLQRAAEDESVNCQKPF